MLSAGSNSTNGKDDIEGIMANSAGGVSSVTSIRAISNEGIFRALNRFAIYKNTYIKVVIADTCPQVKTRSYPFEVNCEMIARFTIFSVQY